MAQACPHCGRPMRADAPPAAHAEPPHRALSDLIAMRHLASLLVAGWLLMVPPPKDGPDGTKVPDLDKPVSEWIQGRAYDSAEACEEMRAVGWNLEGATPERLAFTRGSRCVPAEHVYKPKPK